MDLRIGFLNIYEGCSYLQERHPYIPDVYLSLIKKYSPDLLCLAECPINNDEGASDFIKLFSSSLRLPYTYAQACDKAFIGPHPYSGIAILSKYPVDNYHVTQYDNPHLSIAKENGNVWRTHDKYIQAGDITVAGNSTYSIINTHVLPLTIFGEEMDGPIGKQLFETLERSIDACESPLILTGDFNKKAIPFPKLLPRHAQELIFPTDTLRTSIFDEPYRGSQIAVNSSITIKKAEAIPTESDAYLVTVEISY